MIYVDEPSTGASSWTAYVPQKIRDQAALYGVTVIGVFKMHRWDGYGWLMPINPEAEPVLLDDINAASKLETRVYRYMTETMTGGMMPLIQLNIKTGLIHFLKPDSDGAEFESRGIRAKFVRLLSNAI